MPYYIEDIVILGFFPWRDCAVYSFKKSMLVQLFKDWLLGQHNKYIQLSIFFKRFHSIIKGLKRDVVRIFLSYLKENRCASK